MLNAQDFGALPNGQDCTKTLQAAFDASCGKPVRIPAGVYVASHLVIGSGTQVIGDGIGQTIIRDPGTPHRGKVWKGADVGAVLAFVAENDSSIRDLTIDLSTPDGLGTGAGNGISILPAGKGFTGDICERITIERCRVQVAGYNRHQYFIWNLRGRDVVIQNCEVDGGSVDCSEMGEQEGIESYGGKRVEILNNQVCNVSGAGINIASSRAVAPIGPTNIDTVTAKGNTVTNCCKGVYLQTSNDPIIGAMNARKVMIDANKISRCYGYGVRVWADAGTSIMNLDIRRNSIDFCERGIALFSYGDYLDQDSGAPDDQNFGYLKSRACNWGNVKISNNTIRDSKNLYEGAFSLFYAKNVALMGNTVERVTNPQGYVVGCSGVRWE